MDFNLFYTTTRASHGRIYDEQIKANTAITAFQQAVEIMKNSDMTPDAFSCFYVAPSK